jgi:hypothetical protein
MHFKKIWLRPYYLSNQLFLHNTNLIIIALFTQKTFALEEGNKVNDYSYTCY